MTDRETGGSARESSVGEKRALGAEPAALDVGGGVQHLLHSGPTFGAFVPDNNHVPGLHLTVEDTL